MKYTFKLKGLDCANCAAQIEHAIEKIEGIENVSISFMSQKMIIECKEDEKEEIINKVKKVAKREEPDVKIEEQ